MKKVLMLLFAALLITPVTLNANPEKVDSKTEKAMLKQCKAKSKQLKKAGWEIFGSSLTLEGALQKHYEQLIELGEDVIEIYGTATRVKSKNAGIQMADNNACITYAKQQGSDLKGRIVSELSVNTDDPAMEMDKFLSAYESKVEKELKGEMRPSYKLIRTNSDGTFEVEVYYLVSESAASRARIRAYENSLAESEAAQRNAEKIAEFVKAGFKN